MIPRRSVMTTAGTFGAAAFAGFAAWPRLGDYEDVVATQRQLLGATPEIEDIIRLATLAANGHNTQPWLFELAEDRVTLFPDHSRATPVVDPDDHHLYVSLGCAAENLILASRASGFSADAYIHGGAAPRIDISLAAADKDVSPLYHAIPLRQSTRAVFDGAGVSSEDLGLLASAAAEEGVAVDIRTQRKELDVILDFVVAGNTAQMEDPAFVQELRDWIRFSPQQAISTADGLFTAASGNPVAPSWLGRRLFRSFFKTEAENDKYRAHLQSSAGVAIFTADQEGPEHWMRVGRSFQRFALQATALNIRNAHINQPVEVATLRPEFAGWLGLPGRRPDLVVRFGRGPRLPMSLRRPPSAVIRNA